MLKSAKKNSDGLNKSAANKEIKYNPLMRVNIVAPFFLDNRNNVSIKTNNIIVNLLARQYPC